MRAVGLRCLNATTSRNVPTVFYRYGAYQRTQHLNNHGVHAHSRTLISSALLLSCNTSACLRALHCNLRLNGVRSYLVARIRNSRLIPRRVDCHGIAFTCVRSRRAPFAICNSTRVKTGLRIHRSNYITPSGCRKQIIFRRLATFRPIVVRKCRIVPLGTTRNYRRPLVCTVLGSNGDLLCTRSASRFPRRA